MLTERFDPDRLVEKACEAADSDDFGGDDGWRDGLARLTDGLVGEARLSPLGVEIADADIMRALTARTDERLRTTLQRVLTEYSAKIYDPARALPGAENMPEKTLAALAATLTNTFDGAAIVGAVLAAPEVDVQQIPLLAALLSDAYG